MIFVPYLVKAVVANRSLFLFLDLDGVLYVPKEGRSLDYVPLLEAALEPYPEIKIVISSSSSWQGYFKHDDFLVFLGPLASRLLGVTSSVPLSSEVKASPQLSNWPALKALAQRREHQHLVPPGIRQRAIEAWMAANAPGERWIALDDVAANFDEDCRRAVILDLLRNPPAAEFQKLVTALANPESIPPVDDFPICARIRAQMGKSVGDQAVTGASLSFFDWWRMATSAPVYESRQHDGDQYIQLDAVAPVWRSELMTHLVTKDGPAGEIRLADWCDFLSTTLVRLSEVQPTYLSKL